MDEKGACICMLVREEVVVLIRITKMYIGIPKNCMLVIVVECILADGKAIPLVIIIPRVMIITS
jgi:hypothetical protein